MTLAPSSAELHSIAGRRHLFLQWSYFSNVLLHRYFLLSQFESFHNKLSKVILISLGFI